MMFRMANAIIEAYICQANMFGTEIEWSENFPQRAGPHGKGLRRPKEDQFTENELKEKNMKS